MHRILKASFLSLCLIVFTLFTISCGNNDDPSPSQQAANSSGTEGQFLFNSSRCELDSIYSQNGFGGPFGEVVSNDTSIVTYSNGVIAKVVTRNWETQFDPEFGTETRFFGTDEFSIETVNGNRITKVTKETNGSTASLFEGTYEDNKLVSFLQSSTTKYELTYDDDDLLSSAEQLRSSDGGTTFDPVRTFGFTVSDGNITQITGTPAGETEPDRIEKYTYDDNPNYYAGGVAYYSPVSLTVFVAFCKNNILTNTIEIPDNPENTFTNLYTYTYNEQGALEKVSSGRWVRSRQ